MTGLESKADQVVREAVDAYLDGQRYQDHAGETVFETRNSRYRLMDGTLFSAPDSALIGAELVGWLVEEGHQPLMESAWQPGARAVLVDRKRGRHIIVTSATRMLHLEDRSAGSGVIQAGSVSPRTPTPVPPSPKVTSIPRSLPIPARPPLHMPPRPVAHLPLPSPPPPRPITYALAPLPFPSPPPRPGGYTLPNVQPPKAHAYAQPTEEDREDMEVTEEEQHPLPLVRQQHTLLSAQAPRAVARGALLR